MKTIEFDITRINILKASYEFTIELCEKDFSGVNLNSIPQVKSYFREEFSLDLPDTQIMTIKHLWESCDPDSHIANQLFSLLTFLKSRATLRNYINCILKHEIGGIVTLRLVDERLLMPNRRPTSYNEELIECIVTCCDEVSQQIESYRTASSKRCSVPC
jgi:hypothetical protein